MACHAPTFWRPGFWGIFLLTAVAAWASEKDIHLCPGLQSVSRTERTISAVKPFEANPQPLPPPLRCEDKLKRPETNQPGYYLVIQELTVSSNGEEATGPHAPLGNLQIKLFPPQDVAGLTLEQMAQAHCTTPFLVHLMLEGPFQQGQGVCEWHQETWYDEQAVVYDPPMVLADLGPEPAGRLKAFIYESDCGCSWQRFFGRRDTPLAWIQFSLVPGHVIETIVADVLTITWEVENRNESLEKDHHSDRGAHSERE